MTTAVLAGLGSAVPPHVVTNAMLAEQLDTSDAWIRSRTGIARRHIAGADLTTSDLAVEAGQQALSSAGVTAVDYLVLATTTPDRLCPATAPEVAARLGMSGIPAFDVSAVCSGFLYGLQVARSLLESRLARSVLLVGAETFSTLLDPADRTTRPIFGDGAGAVVLRAGRADEPGAVHAVDVHSDGNLAELITVEGGGAKARAQGRADPSYIRMQGRETFVHAVTHMEEAILRTLAEIGWLIEEVDHLVGHQANERILVALAKRLGLAQDTALINIQEVGNTAAASIPLALDRGSRTGRLRKDDRVVLAAFGAGATWGAAALTWPNLDVT